MNRNKDGGAVVIPQVHAVAGASGGGKPPNKGRGMDNETGHYSPHSPWDGISNKKYQQVMSELRKAVPTDRQVHALQRQKTMTTHAKLHTPYSKVDSQLLRTLSMSQLESHMQSRDAPNEFGASYHPKDLQRSLTMASQRPQSKDSNINTVSMEDLTHSHDDKSGRRFSVSMKDKVMTHSHPQGNPLSDDDLRQAMIHDMAEIRAVGKGRTFAMRRPESGWPVQGQDQKERARGTVSHMANASIAATGPEHLDIQNRRGNSALQRAQIGSKGQQNFLMLRQHETLSAFAKATGATYEYPQEWAQQRRQSLDKKHPLQPKPKGGSQDKGGKGGKGGRSRTGSGAS